MRALFGSVSIFSLVFSIALPNMVRGEDTDIQTTAGPVVLYVPIGGALAHGGIYWAKSDTNLGPYLSIRQSDPKNLFTMFIDADYFTRNEKYARQYIAVAGNARFLLNEVSDAAADVEILIASIDAAGNYPMKTKGPVSIPFTIVPNVKYEQLIDLLKSSDWYVRAASAWALGENRYANAAEALYNALLVEDRRYSASYEAVAILRTGSKYYTKKVNEWLNRAGGSEDEIKLRNEVRFFVSNLHMAIPDQSEHSARRKGGR